jgi:ribonuclease VapC
MFVDASALVGILAREIDAPTLAGRLGEAERIFTSSVAIYEAVLGLARARNMSIGDAERVVANFLSAARAEIIPITPEIGRGAISAFDRFGRGRHPARLNMGDCFAYACARTLAVPLLFKGDDFSQTDVAIA